MNSFAGSLRRLITLVETMGEIYYHGTNEDFDAFRPYDGALGLGVYITSYRSIAKDYAERRQREKGGSIVVIPVMVDGDILWNGTPQFNEAIEEVATLMRQAERKGHRPSRDDLTREVITKKGYVGYGSSENILIFDVSHLRRLSSERSH